MSSNKRGIINKLVAILIILFLNFTDFLFVGKSLITYAVDNMEGTVNDGKTSKAMLYVSRNKLLNSENNENVKISVILRNSKEDEDLYQNPNIKITMPKGIEVIDAKYKLIYANGLKIEDTKIDKENDNYVIMIKLTGTQKEYNPETIVGTTLIIDALINTRNLPNLDEAITSNYSDEIILNYSNELATSYENNAEVKANLNLEDNKQTSSNEVQDETEILEDEIEEENTYNGPKITSNIKAYIGGKRIKDGDTVNTGEIIKYVLTIKNTGNVLGENLNIEANIPEGTKVIRYVKTSGEEEQEQNGTLVAIKDSFKETEVPNNKLTGTIDKLQVNEDVTLTYEIKVPDNMAGSKISANALVNFNAEGDTSKLLTSNTKTISNEVNKAELDMSMVMISRGDKEILPGEIYAYELTVKNKSENVLSNINVDIKTNSGYTLDRVIDENDEILSSENNRFVIDNIEVGKERKYKIQVEASEDSKNTAIYTIANNKYRSNEIEETIKLDAGLDISLNTENDGDTIENGDKVTYNIKITNKENSQIESLNIVEELSNYLDISKITANGEELEYATQYLESKQNEELSNKDGNYIEESDKYLVGIKYEKPINVGESVTIVIETTSDSETEHINNIHLSSVAEINADSTTIKSNQVNHILKATSFKEDDKNSNETQENTDEKYTISGTTWIDKNKNGSIDTNEENVSGIKVKLIDLQDNTTIETTTTENGFYAFTEIQKGNYITVYEYDNEEYLLTKYQEDETQNTRNSDVENVILRINGEEGKSSGTDILKIESNSLTNINLGLLDTNAGNHQKTEDDMVIEEKDEKINTTTIITYITILLSIIVIIVIGAYMIIKKKTKKDIDL